jgi:MFS family permease
VSARLNLPPAVVPIFWGLMFLEATYGAYMSVWPLWIERLGAPIAIVGLVLGAGGFLRLFVLGPSAMIADRFGYRRTILAARLVAVVGFLGAAIATHWTQLLLVVLALAIGEMIFPLVHTLAATGAGHQKMRVFALVFNVGPSIALAISPLVGAGLVGLLGMRSAFVLGAIFTLISMYFFSRASEPETDPAHAEGHPPSYRRTLAEPGVRLVARTLLVSVFALSLGVSLIPTFLEDVRGFEPAAITALSALTAVGSAALGLSVARLPALQKMPFVTAGISTGVMILAFIILRQTAFVPLVVVAFLIRGGLFATWATLISALGELAPARLRSRSFAVLEMVGGLAFSLGPMAAGFLYARHASLPFEVAIVLVILLMPVYYVAHRRAVALRRQESESTAEAVESQASESPA